MVKDFHLEHKLSAVTSRSSTLSELPKDSCSSQPIVVLQPRRATVETLEALFDVRSIRTEFRNLQALGNKPDSHKNWKKADYSVRGSSLPKMLAELVTATDVSNVVTAYRTYAPVGPNHETLWDSSLAEMSWMTVVRATRILPVLLKEQAKYEFMARMMQWESCRALVAIFDWHVYDSKQLISTIMEKHKSDGYSGVLELFPRFADIAEHAVQYTAMRRRDLRGKTDGTNQNTRQRDHTDPAPGFQIEDVTKLPSDLYHLIEAQSQTPLTIKHADHPIRGGKNIGANAESFYSFAGAALHTWMGIHVIAQSNKDVDAFFNQNPESHGDVSEHRHKFDPQSILARCIARGGTIKAVWQAVGHEGISIAHHMKGLIASPGLFYGDHYKRNERLALALESDFSGTVKPLFEKLDELVSPEHSMIAEQMALWTHHQLLELHHGKPISETQFFDLDLMMDEGDIPLINLSQQTRIKARMGKAKRLEPVTRDRLFANGVPVVAMLALIVREALNEREKRPFASEHLRRILEGRNTATGHPQFDRDQTDPVRGDNSNVERLRRKLPGEALTTSTGLSSLLAWMSTGQGSETTRDFVESMQVFWFEDLESCVEAFQNVLDTNDAVLKGIGKLDTAAAEHIDGYCPIDNPRIYGAVSNHLMALYTVGRRLDKRKATLSEKFKPFFEPDVTQKWRDFIGPMYGLNPSTFEGKKRTWTQGLEFLIALRLPGFKGGLTLLQTAHNLTYLGATTPPDDDRISDWIGSNPRLGAFRGLAYLGFNLVDVGYLQTAYRIVYDHFDQFLTNEDKARLDFGAIFVEQLLCKVVRWEHRLRMGGMQFTLLDLAMKALEAEMQETHKKHDHMRFPVPLQLAEESVIRILRVRSSSPSHSAAELNRLSFCRSTRGT